jgi:hypothetical protein
MANAINSFTSALRLGQAPKAARAYIIPLDIHNSDNVIKDDARTFQYFPESIQDSKATNYQTKVIPGLSHPLYQWTSSGARTIAFQAVYTRDRGLTASERKAVKITRQETKTFASSAKAAISSLGSMVSAATGIATNVDPRNVDIPSAVAFLRSFLDPEYSSDGRGVKGPIPDRPYPPRKLILGLPGVRMNWGVPSLPPSEMYCIMTQCEVNYDGFFGDGTPRMARVDLSFSEIIQIAGEIKVQDAANRRAVGQTGYTLTDKALKK